MVEFEHLGFFYGTLRKGRRREGGGVCGDDRTVVMPEAYIDGFRLYDLGHFPGVQPGDATVRGEVHGFDAETLARLDRYEGYRADDPEGGLYNRVRVQAYSPEGETAEVWLYVFNNRSLARLRTVPSGDWFEHKGLYQKGVIG